jgi:peptidoglycan hydrolase-like protein with peptidoglycan-binding domain
MSDVVEPTAIEEQPVQGQEPMPESVPAPEPAPVPESAPVDTAVTKQQKRGSKPEQQVSHVVSGNATDDVYLDRCVYENKYARKSLTIHHVQRRLVELGYHTAGSDKDGWYSEFTAVAVSAFQKDRSLAGDGGMNSETFIALFAGDPNVTVHA